MILNKKFTNKNEIIRYTFLFGVGTHAQLKEQANKNVEVWEKMKEKEQQKKEKEQQKISNQ